MEDNKAMLDFVKALAHADRLKIVGMLAQRPARLVEITEGVDTESKYIHISILI